MTITITGKITQTGRSILSSPATTSGDTAVIGGGTDGSGMSSMEEFTISSLGNATTFGALSQARRSLAAVANTVRGVWAGGNTDASIGQDTIDYIIISTPGTASDFGDLTRERARTAGVSNGTNDRGIIVAGGIPSFNITNSIDYITISSTGNALAWGNSSSILSNGIRDFLDGVSSGTNERGMFVGGRETVGVHTDHMEYLIISTPSASVDWGNLTTIKRMVGAVSNDINDKAVFSGGWGGTAVISVIDWRSFTSGSNAANFGTITGRYGFGSASNGINERGVMCGGYIAAYSNVIEYVTINSNGNATDFGDLLAVRHESEAISDGQA